MAFVLSDWSKRGEVIHGGIVTQIIAKETGIPGSKIVAMQSEVIEYYGFYQQIDVIGCWAGSRFH